MEVVNEYQDAKIAQSLPLLTCRCCMLQSNISMTSDYIFWNGRRVFCMDLINDTFGLTLSSSSELTKGICESCTTRLIDATEFKKQVQECESTLKKQCASGCNDEPELKLIEKVIKGEEIDNTVSIYDNDDHLTSDIKAKVEQISKLVKKRLGNVKSNNSMVTKKYLVPTDQLKDVPGMPATSGVKAVKIGNRTMYVKVKSINSQLFKQVEGQHSKNVLSRTKVPNKDDPKKMSMCSPVIKEAEYIKMRRNRNNLLLHTTLYPFRLPKPYLLLACVYCEDENIEPDDYRTHIDESHLKTADPKRAFRHLTSEAQSKVECSNLKCKICNEPFDTIETIAEHLKQDHYKNIDLTADLGVVPFKFKKSEVLACAVCQKQFLNVLTLSKHTSTHYSRFTCDKCGKNFSSSSTLNAHQRTTHAHKPNCVRCKTAFEDMKELKAHCENTYRCRKFVCTECGERFVELSQKQKHLSSVHGRMKNFPCRICQKEFPSRVSYYNHHIKEHVTDCPKCAICGKKFKIPSQLKEHMSTHTGETPYQCELCDKAYRSRKILQQHVRINHKHRFSCKECNKHFGCKSSMNNHMLNCH